MLNEKQMKLCQENTTDFSDLKAMVFNCSLKKLPEKSHTRLLLSTAESIMKKNGISVEYIHLANEQIPPGIYADMTDHGWDKDEWPKLWKKVHDTDIVIVGTPIWLGEESSICRILIERLYAMSAELNDRGQSVFYGKVGGTVITGNEDGIKHCAMSLLYALQHLGFIIPPQADCGWIGEAGPGPSYGDRPENDSGEPAGYANDFTQRNATIMTWNLMHMAHILKNSQGFPNHGNDRRAWKAGCRAGFENPEHRS